MSPNHVDRRSVNAILFEAFWALLETVPTTSAPNGYEARELRWLLRRAALLEVARRAEAYRVKTGRLPLVTWLNDDNEFRVKLDSGGWRELTEAERAELDYHVQRVTRGRPEIQGAVR